MLLQHLENLVKTAYSGASSDPGESGQKMMEEYSRELAEDIQKIKTVAASFNQDATAAVSRYQAEYEMHLTVWLNALGKCNNHTPTEGETPESIATDIQRRSRKAENKLKRFREWRDRAVEGIQRRFLPKKTPVTELDKAKANLEERLNRQQQMKKANTIIRSQKDVTQRLMELLGPGSEAEVARIQQPDEKENTGYSMHELNNNNANIFRLKRRVTELEQKIGLMDRSNEEVEERNGIRMILNYASDRIQLFFTVKPRTGRLRQLKGNGWHWSPSAGCWQRKITESARKSADRLYGIEEDQALDAEELTPKKEKKVKVPKEKKKKEIKAKPVAEKTETVAAVSATKTEAVVVKADKPEKKEKVKKEPVAKWKAGKTEKTGSKIALMRELKAVPATIVKKEEEKPKVIDWSKIASQVESRGERESEIKVNVRQASEEPADSEPAIRGYSYEEYSD